MKFEQLLKIYWSRGFLYGGRTQSFATNFKDFFLDKNGLSATSEKAFIKRFEIQHLSLKKNKSKFLSLLPLNKRKIFNMYLSQLISINASIFELQRYNLIRLYLIKTFRGRCHALGKPSRGQRTWSNAQNAYKCNKVTRTFIQDVKKFNFVEKKKESLNLKFLKKKIRVKAPKIKMIFTKKRKNLWF